jgi:polysaccharide pyruvyl transferase WcaK-like protein
MKPLPVKDLKIKPSSVGINVNGLMYFNNYRKLAGQFELYPELLVQIISFIQKQDIAIYLIPHTYDIHSPIDDDDLSAIKDLYSKIENKNNVYIVNYDFNAPQLKYVISKMFFFIGSRMHACFAALFNNVPSIGIAYSDKFVGSFKKFGLEQNCFKINNIQRTELDNIFVQIKDIIGKKNIN